MKRTILFFALSAIPAWADLAAGQQALKNRDYVKALTEFLPLAQRGNALAQFRMGEMYSEGEGVQKDEKEGLRWYRLAAEQGNASAQSSLGGMYYEGHGVQKDDKEAARWFRLAAEQGDPDASRAAQFNLGKMYYLGDGVQRDYVESARWLHLAAEQGLPDAQVALGMSYDLGKDVPQDYVQAYMWFNLAGASGNATGIESRDVDLSRMTPDQIAEGQRLAREWKPPQLIRPLVQSSKTMDWPQIFSAGGTWALVFLTLWLVIGQLSKAEKQLKSQLYLQIRQDFDGDRMVSARKKLAQQLLDQVPHDGVQEKVMDFFEDMGMLLRRRHLDRGMVLDTFSYYVTMWWSSSKKYVFEERARQRGDDTLFADFQAIAQVIAAKMPLDAAGIEPSPSEIEDFLKGEAQL